MKLLEHHFEDYLKNKNKIDIHPKFNYDIFPKNIIDLKNIIIYGPPGIGKYTQMLSIIKQYSPSELKYEKKMTVTYNKVVYYFKISDIHFEVDLALLGCNSKLLWNEIFNNIIDVILTRTNKCGIIVCKNFHEIHPELLEVFYSYIQSNFNSNIELKFILITEELSFISNNIINSSKIISLARPPQTQYNKAFKINTKNCPAKNITNIKNLELSINLSENSIFNDTISFIISKPEKTLNFQNLREKIYNLFIYNLNIHTFIWNIFDYIISNNHINEDDMPELLLKTNECLKFFNNNYRSIFHLENYLLYIISLIHGLRKSM